MFVWQILAKGLEHESEMVVRPSLTKGSDERSPHKILVAMVVWQMLAKGLDDERIRRKNPVADVVDGPVFAVASYRLLFLFFCGRWG